MLLDSSVKVRSRNFDTRKWNCPKFPPVSLSSRPRDCAAQICSLPNSLRTTVPTGSSLVPNSSTVDPRVSRRHSSPFSVIYRVLLVGGGVERGSCSVASFSSEKCLNHSNTFSAHLPYTCSFAVFPSFQQNLQFTHCSVTVTLPLTASHVQSIVSHQISKGPDTQVHRLAVHRTF